MYETDSEKLALAIEWFKSLLREAINDVKWAKELGKDDYHLAVVTRLKDDLNIALKEVTATKWTYQKVEDAMGEIIKRHVPGPTWAGIEKASPEIALMLEEAGWGDEEYHWECIRHNDSKPSFCACWNISPENRDKNPLPLDSEKK